MLFRFGTFWQTIGVVVGSWLMYGIFDFEFTTITFLALILAMHMKNAR
tara:strand:- start:198 stop:341 length:144 start_codon:yes stop_codon:yes gene_type:complete